MTVEQHCASVCYPRVPCRSAQLPPPAQGALHCPPTSQAPDSAAAPCTEDADDAVGVEASAGLALWGPVTKRKPHGRGRLARPCPWAAAAGAPPSAAGAPPAALPSGEGSGLGWGRGHPGTLHLGEEGEEEEEGGSVCLGQMWATWARRLAVPLKSCQRGAGAGEDCGREQPWGHTDFGRPPAPGSRVAEMKRLPQRAGQGPLPRGPFPQSWSRSLPPERWDLRTGHPRSPAWRLVDSRVHLDVCVQAGKSVNLFSFTVASKTRVT